MDTTTDETPALSLSRQEGRTLVGYLREALKDSLGVPVHDRFSTDTAKSFLRVWWSTRRATCNRIMVCLHGQADRERVSETLGAMVITVGERRHGFRPGADGTWEPFEVTG